MAPWTRGAIVGLALVFAFGAQAQPQGKPQPKLPPAAKPNPDAPAPKRPPLQIKPELLRKPALPAPPAAGKPGPAAAPAPTATPPVAKTTPSDARWTEQTADTMVDAALARAQHDGPDALAGLLVALAMRDHAGPDHVSRGLGNVARQASTVAQEARLLQAWMTPAPFGRDWQGLSAVTWNGPPQASGIVTSMVVVGPFQDTGGGLIKAEGPEAEGQSFANLAADYSWGDYEVKPRPIIPLSSPAMGVPLGLYVSPRTETCTYVASKIELQPAVKSVVVRVAAAGSVRLIIDGETVATSEEVHSRGVLDRLATEVELGQGPHLIAAKVCSSPLADDGRVRLRVTDPSGRPVSVTSSSDLSALPADVARRREPSKAPPKPGKAPPTAPKLAHKPVKTPLELITKVAAEPSTSQALAAAVTLALAGADDTRSPRLHGLLDRVAKASDVTPDQLACAGWLSPFGANKSGWLNQSAERAAAQGDRSTGVFALSRLAEAQIARGSLDSAMRTMEREPLASQKDIGARMLRTSIKARAGGAGAMQSALLDLKALDGEVRQRGPRALLAELVNLSRFLPEQHVQYVERHARATEAGRTASYAYAHHLRGAAAFETAVARLVAHLSSSRELTDLGRELDSLERYAWAREVLELATRLTPNEADAWEALAQVRDNIIHAERRANAPPSESAARAAAARKRALDLKRGDVQIKAELAFRERTENPKTDAKTAAAGEDERFLVPFSVIAERAKKSPAEVGQVFERTLHFQRIVTYHDDKRVSQLIHQAREIVVEPRTQAELFERNIPYEGDQVELVFARVHRKDGTQVEPDEQSAAGAHIKWPELKTGDVVEYAVRSWTSGPVGRRGDAPFYFIDYVGATSTRPVLFNEVIVDHPLASPLGVDVVAGKADKSEKRTEGTREIIRHTWERPPVVADEPYAPRPTEVLPLVIGSTFRSWDEFRGWYREAIKGFSEPDDQIKRLAAELTKGKKTEQDKLEALFNYVADDIRYVNYVSGEYWLPNRPQQCLARKQGDCDDKAILLISLLKSIGVEATPVLVQTRLTAMPSVLAGQTAAVPLFDHGIAYIPGKGGKPGTWLDATSPQSRLGPLPSMDARARALFIYEGDAKIIETPASSPADHGSQTEWTLTLDDRGGAKVVGKEKHLGDWAFELRNNLIEEDARAQWLEQYLSGRYFPSVEVDAKIDYAPDAGTLAYSARTEGLARREGEHLVVPVGGSQSLLATYAGLPKRTLPLVLPPQMAPSRTVRTMTVTAPAGFSVKDLPPGGEAKGGSFGFGKVTFQNGKAPRSVLVTTELVFDKSTIPVDEYPAFRKWLESVDALSRQSVRFVSDAAQKRP